MSNPVSISTVRRYIKTNGYKLLRWEFNDYENAYIFYIAISFAILLEEPSSTHCFSIKCKTIVQKRLNDRRRLKRYMRKKLILIPITR